MALPPPSGIYVINDVTRGLPMPMHESVNRRTFLNSSLIGLMSLGTSGAFAAQGSDATGASAQAAASGMIVRTAAGDLRGANLNGVYAFKGVRYGEDTAKRRFQAPEPVRPWTGVRDALDYAPKAPQPDINVFAIGPNKSFASSEKYSEDCLFLNLWTPGIQDNKRRPVMVWLHGGGWVYGGANRPDADGERLARYHDVVMVGVTHRLGVFGYSYLPGILGANYADSGNAGTLDMVLALRWIKDNIAAFGGDPNNVMIFGVSGGGAKVSALMAMPAAKGLFHRAAVQSGSMLNAMPPAVATQASENFLKALDIPLTDAGKLLTLSTDNLLDGFRKMNADGLGGAASMAPIVDGVNLPRHPFDPTAPDISSDVPMIIGTVLTESALFLGLADESVFHLTWEDAAKRLAAMPPGMMRPPGDAAENIRKARALMPKATPSEIFFLLTTEAMGRQRAVRQAELASQRLAPAYMYLVEWKTPLDGGKWGSPHGMCEPLVMDNVRNTVSMFGEDGLAEAQLMANKMTAAWVAFARAGNPDTPAIPHWPPYDTTTRKTMIFDRTCHVASDPNGGLRRLFAKA